MEVINGKKVTIEIRIDGLGIGSRFKFRADGVPMVFDGVTTVESGVVKGKLIKRAWYRIEGTSMPRFVGIKEAIWEAGKSRLIDRMVIKLD